MCKASVIIAAYNIEKYIERCLDSIINQTFKDIEIIVVNDGSTDNTLSIISDKARVDNRIKIVNKKNGGLIEARKSGFNVCKGKYILFVDGDDYLDKRAIEILYDKAESNLYDIVCYKYKIAYSDGRIKKYSINYEGIDSDQYIKYLLTGKIPVNIFLRFIRREYIVNSNFSFPSNISYGEDLATTISLAMFNPKVGFINSDLYYYYQRVESLSNKVSSKMLEIIKAINFIDDELIKNNLKNKYKQEFEFLAYMHNYKHRTKTIFQDEEIYKKLYISWRKRKINIYKNKYYKEMTATISNKQKLALRVMERNYGIYKLYSKYKLSRNINICNEKFK